MHFIKAGITMLVLMNFGYIYLGARLWKAFKKQKKKLNAAIIAFNT